MQPPAHGWLSVRRWHGDVHLGGSWPKQTRLKLAAPTEDTRSATCKRCNSIVTALSRLVAHSSQLFNGCRAHAYRSAYLRQQLRGSLQSLLQTIHHNDVAGAVHMRKTKSANMHARTDHAATGQTPTTHPHPPTPSHTWFLWRGSFAP